MKNSHLAKSERNQGIIKLLVRGWTQANIATEFNLSIQRVNDLVAKQFARGLLRKTKKGFVLDVFFGHARQKNL